MRFSSLHRSAFVLFLLASSLLAMDMALLSGCAQVARPTGGPRDTLPPLLDTLRSTPNMQTRFQKQRIELTFDEFLRLNDVFNQVVISPPLAKRPQITLHHYRTVWVDFAPEEVLRPEATYTINFGEAIKDFTEGNTAPLRFVFATGDYIDSLEVQGALVDARTGEPTPDVLLLLYDNLADSVVRTERPFYFARTGKDGSFRIENVKSDTFKVFALEDANLNYLFDQKTERIGFLDTAIILSDTLSPFIRLQVFQEELPLQVMKKAAVHYGRFDLQFNRAPEGVRITPVDPPPFLFQEQEKDTIRIWYHQDSTRNWSLTVQTDTLVDTVRILVKDRASFLEKTTLYQSSFPAAGKMNRINPFEPLQMQFNHPLKQIDTAKIRLLKDTTETPVAFTLATDSLPQRALAIAHRWQPNILYRLQLLPGAATDLYDIQNDTIEVAFQANAEEDYGAIKFTLNDLDSTLAYVVTLKLQNATVATFFVEEQASFTEKVTALKPGNYQLEIIEDQNRNRRWDPGHYDLKRQPESIFTKTLEQLRANWEVEAIVSIQKE